MDFNIDEVRTDILKAKEYLGAKHPLCELEKLGEGTHSKVYRLKSVALKHLFCGEPPLKQDQITAGEEAIKRKYNFAPYLETMKDPKCKDRNFAFSPCLDGLRMWDLHADAMVKNLGATGMEEYYNNGLGLRSLGFRADINPSNFIVTPRAINYIDMFFETKIDYNPNKVLERLTKAVLWADQVSHCFNIKNNFPEIADNMRTALNHFKDNGGALTALTDYETDGTLIL